MEGVKFASEMAANTNRRALRDIKNIIGAPHQHLAKTCCCGSQEPTSLCWTPPCYQEICCNAGNPTYKFPTELQSGWEQRVHGVVLGKATVVPAVFGRPWEEYARTIYVSCYLGKVVRPKGWLPWRGDFALRTLYYGEFDSRGPGANHTARIEWSSQTTEQQNNMLNSTQ